MFPERIDEIKRKVLEATLDIAEEYGINFEFGSTGYKRGKFFTTDLTVSVVDSKGQPQDPLAEAFREVRSFLDIPSHIDVGTKVKIRGRVLTVRGYDSKKRKYRIIFEDANGRSLKGTVDALKNSYVL